MPRIDMTGVDDGRAPLPAGEYQARLTKVSYAVSKNNNPTQVFEFTISDEASPYAGRKASVSKALKLEALWSYKPVLAALGMPNDLISSKEFDTDTVGEYVGTEVTIVITHRQGDSTNDDGTPRILYGIDKVLPLQNGGVDWGR